MNNIVKFKNKTLMKKIFTLVMMSLVAFAAQAKEVTIYVQAPAGTNIYFWNIAETVDWPGEALTEQKTVKNPATNEDMTFYYRTFEVETSINVIFNKDGQQTKDLTGITTDRYYIYDGEKGVEDISEQFIEIPDAEISNVTLPGNHNGWDISNSTPFTVVEKNKTYSLGVDLTDVTVDDDVWLFKLGVNNSQWIGFYQVTLDAPAYVVEAMENSNFEVDLSEAGKRQFTITATWAGGKSAEEGWTIKIEEGITNGVNVLKVNNADNAVYDLQGRRVLNPTKGLYIVNGRKVIR